MIDKRPFFGLYTKQYVCNDATCIARTQKDERLVGHGTSS